MKAILTLATLTLLALTSLQTPSPALADHEQPTTGHGSSPWASQSPDAWRPNANAGYPGSDLPPSEYNPDAPRYGQPPKTAPMPPLDGGLYSGQSIVETPTGRMVCSAPDYAGRVHCR